MTSDMDWTPDFCLFCDKQTPEGIYCSQACRLADLEKDGFSEPVSPGRSFYGQQEWQFPANPTTSSHHHSHASQFHLQPAVNFDALRSAARTESAPTSPRSTGLPHQPSYVSPTNSTRATVTRSYSEYNQAKPRPLNTSSSRSSLSSISSTNTNSTGLSDQALSQLRSYYESFDHTRDWRRRRTLG